MRSSGSSRRLLMPLSVGVGSTALLVGLAVWLDANDTDKVTKLVGALVGVLGLLVSTATYLRTRAPADSSGTDASLLDTLAERNLRVAWDDEWRRRRLHDPAPLPVSWVSADELADRWRNIAGGRGDEPRKQLAGSLVALADTFRAVPSRRLVVVGAAGQGKSVLCLHLARELLVRRRPGGPVPVLLGLSSWDPRATELREWLAERLPLDVSPALAQRGRDGRTIARAMVEEGLVIPLLDGLDELPVELHAAAIRGINHAGAGPLFLTCREEAFTAAIDAAHAVVTTAAVVRLVPLAPEDVADWLTRASPPRWGGDKWAPVFTGTAEQDLLDGVLGSPLMVSLARTV